MKLVCRQPLAIKNGWRQITIDKLVPIKGNTMNKMLQTNLPTRRQLHAELDRMTLSADAKVLMGTLLDTTAEVAGRIIEIGREILAFAIDMLILANLRADEDLVRAELDRHRVPAIVRATVDEMIRVRALSLQRPIYDEWSKGRRDWVSRWIDEMQLARPSEADLQEIGTEFRLAA